MNKKLFLLLLFVLLNSLACDTQKQDEKIRSLESDLKVLKSEVADLKQKKSSPEHHYELRNQGLRTWRFDSATGETCIQLTSNADWKNKETKSQSCDCIDASEHYAKMPSDNEVQEKTASNYYNLLVKPACGY